MAIGVERMRKLKLYLETSIFNVATSDQNPEFRDKTLKLFKEIQAGRYEAYTSGIVLQEVNASGQVRAEELREQIKAVELEILEDDAEVEDLAKAYVEAGLVPEKYIDDARHIALASYHEMDAVVSWNFEHMVKLKTIKGIPSVNVLKGYRPIDIVSPLEVVEDDES